MQAADCCWLRGLRSAIRILQSEICYLKSRLDQLLVARGLFESRERAQRAIMAGQVRVSGHLADKASARFPEDAAVAIAAPERYVGRGGHKLEAALAHFGLDPGGLTWLDLCAGTGGFTRLLVPP